MAKTGLYKPKNPKKYKGNPTTIVYRSSWELHFMKFCDRTNSIVEWGSEEIIIPYRSPLDGKPHRYYPDFYIKAKKKNGKNIGKNIKNSCFKPYWAISEVKSESGSSR